MDILSSPIQSDQLTINEVIAIFIVHISQHLVKLSYSTILLQGQGPSYEYDICDIPSSDFFRHLQALKLHKVGNVLKCF